ncbi:tp901 family phage tail tape measure protein [Qipengyuania citrea LAMA 915]|uniref:Tp901 family phage tail tape measure protein n=1 Tax=Qipengyuania citrea LAMA 915 TaxID=1306953 RepID=A0A0L1KF90_9SPHN|nr:phage tail tape measure protein [Qipengyuania citrea]KNH02628.1 tp901 family phage tail tape measure protein [Qipengyuania citrea LAMA 915]
MSNKLSLMVNFIGIDKMSSSLRSITQLGRRGSRSLGELRGEGKKLESQLRDVRRQIDGASGNVSDLVNSERDLERAIERTNRELGERKRLNAIEGDRRAMRARGDALMGQGRENIVAGATMAAPLILAVKAAGEFSSGMVDIQQKADLTDAATAQLASRVVTMAKGAKRMPEDIRAGLDLLLAKGGDSLGLEAAEKIMGPAGRIATAYKVDVPDAASAAYAAISNLKVPAAQSAKVFDIMASAGNAGAFEVKNMARHFPALTAQMQALGEKGAPAVADLSAALQVAMKTAGSEDEAGNNIKNLLAKINAPATIRAFEKNFGVNLPAAMKKLTDAGYSSMEAIAMVTKQATGGDMDKLGFAFEDQQARMGIMALLQNLPEYRKIRAEALAASGTVDRAFDQRAAKDALVNWEAFKGSISSLAIVLGKKLLPPATQAMTMIGNMASRVGDWAQANPHAAATIMKIVAGLAVFRIGLGAAQFAFGAFLKPAANFFAFANKMGGTARLFGLLRSAALLLARGVIQAGLMMMANPMVLAITLLVAAVGGAAYLIYANWDKIKAAFQQGVAFIAGLGSRMTAIGQHVVMGLARGIAAAGGAVWNALKGVVLSGIGKVKNLLGIKSPSRVFMAIGAHTGEGMAVGLDRQRRRVSGAAGRLATGAIAAGSMAMAPTAMAAASASSPGAGGAPLIGELHIHQMPGEDAQDLADRVMAMIRREMAGAAGRSYQE